MPRPQRTCAGCRQVRPADQLLRIVVAGDGTLVPGRPGSGGRGAWLCRDSAGAGAPGAGADLARPGSGGAEAGPPPVGCDPAPDPACLERALAGGFGRAFRRPLGREAGEALRAMMGARGNMDAPTRRYPRH